MTLDGLRVLEVGGAGLSTAYCAKLLADLGADVVKLGDRAEDPLGRYLDAGKRVGDPGAPDIVVEGLGPGAYAGVRPGAALVRISPFGQRGPARDEPATSLTLQAAAGWVNDRGVPGLPPVQVGGRLDEFVVGAYAATAALTALAMSRAQGEPVEVDVSHFLCVHNTVPYQGLLRLALEQLGMGDFKASVTPLGIQPCRDGYVGINILTAQHWADACALLEVPEFAGQQDDLKRDDALLEEFRALIRGWLARRDAEEVIELFQAARIPATPVGTGESMPQYSHWRRRPFFSDGEPGRPWRITPGPPGPPKDFSLAGLRVVDLGVFWAAPYLTCYLGALGADVIKVESTRRPDPHRYSMAFPGLGEEWWECSPLWQGPNFNKRNLALDLSHPDGRAVFDRLLVDADVLVENFSARVMGQLRLDYDDVRRINPSVVMLRMPGFGLDGPWRDYVGWGNAFEQVGGQCQVTGYPDGDPQNPGGFADPTAAFHAGAALLAALEQRRRTGQGVLIEVSQVEVVACTQAEQVIVHARTGEVQGRLGNRSPHVVAQGVYPCAGGADHVALSVRDAEDWERLGKVVGEPLPRDHGAFDACITAWTTARSGDEVASELRAAGVPVAPLFSVDRIYAHPQVLAYDYYQHYEHPVTGVRPYPGWPMQFSAGPARAHRSATARLGQHNEEILGEVGLGPDEVAALQSEGVIGVRPEGV